MEIKIGSYIKIDPAWRGIDWYSDEIFRVMNITEEEFLDTGNVGIVITLDRHLPKTIRGISYNKIHISKAVIDDECIKLMRKEKLENLRDNV